MKQARIAAVFTLALFTAVFCCSQTSAWGQDQAAPAGRILKVTVKYTGAGAVDDTHKLYLFVFDTPDIQSGPMPIGASSTNKNESVVSIENLSVSPVYVAAVFDSNGTYDGMSAPPSGSPAAMYMKEQPGIATAIKIEPGQTGEIEFVFDDSFRMP